MRHSLLHTLGNAVWVARAERRRALPLLATYARLKAGELAAARGREGGPRRETVLGMPVFFHDYYWLLEMYEDIFLRRQYEFESERPAPAIVDAGSNIGLAILFFKRLFPRATLLGFEPDPGTFELLTRNVEANRLDGVRIRNEALYDGRQALDLFGDASAPGSPQMTTSADRLTGAARRVPATRLSKHVTEPVDFLKVDIEGAERVVLDELAEAGKLPLIRRMAIEYHHHMLAGEDGLAGLLTTLERGGFGYQLEARLGGAPGLNPGRFQNILVHAYRKAGPSAPPVSR
jgi:FkbM family methyltransferase